MFKQRAVVVAVCALALVGCGGGGGGGGNESVPSSAGSSDVWVTLSAAEGAEANAVIKDTAAILLGATLYAEYLETGVNQFGGRVPNDSSLLGASEAIACGIYTPSASANIGTALVPANGSSLPIDAAVYCLVEHGTDANDTSYRHYIKITPRSSGASNLGFDVSAFADSLTTAGMQAFLGGAKSLTLIAQTDSTGAATAHTLQGDLPQTYNEDGSLVNAGGQTTVQLGGPITTSANEATATIGLEGSAQMFNGQQMPAGWSATYAAGSKMRLTFTATGVGMIEISLK